MPFSFLRGRQELPPRQEGRLLPGQRDGGKLAENDIVAGQATTRVKLSYFPQNRPQFGATCLIAIS